MRAVLDTNVVVSGIFFGGVPRAILEAWADRRFELCLSPSIFDEYFRTCLRLGEVHPGLDYVETLVTIVGHGSLVPDPEASASITADPDDDRFLRCAQRAAALVVSGDHHLHAVSGWQGVEVITPRDFLTRLGEST